MRLSKEKLLAKGEETGYRPELIEKVSHLIVLLEGFCSHPFFKGRWALKGGTALNLFCFNLPRLSVDIDLNYIGSPDLETTLRERPKFLDAIEAVCSREGFAVRRISTSYAAEIISLRYESALGRGGNLGIDLNFLYRIPLWEVEKKDSQEIGLKQARSIPLLNVHELAGGKLAALFSRMQARDLFDTRSLLEHGEMDQKLLRLAFVIYGGANARDWRNVSIEDVDFTAEELDNKLLPLLRRKYLEEFGDTKAFGKHLVAGTRECLRVVLPLSEEEIGFLECLIGHGEIKPELITVDEVMIDRIKNHPALQWKAKNVQAGKLGK